MAKAVDDNYLGSSEPKVILQELDTNAPEYVKAFSWYNYFYDAKKYRKYIVTFMKDKYTQEDIKILENCSDNLIQPVYCSIARMHSLGWNLPQKFLDKIHTKIKEIVNTYVEVIETNKPVVVNVVARMKEKQSMLIGVFEMELDLFFEHYHTKFSPYEYLNKMQVAPAHAVVVAEYYEKLLKELRQVENDPDLKFGYRNLSKKQLKSYTEFITLIVDDANRWANNKKKAPEQKAPRKVKEKTPDKIVKYLNYLKEFPELKLISVDPTSILKASSLWAYNVKYKTLTVFYALEGGLMVENSSIRNFNPQDSIMKTLRKPEATLGSLLTSGKVTMKTLMGTLTTKPALANGRINKDTILVKVVK